MYIFLCMFVVTKTIKIMISQKQFQQIVDQLDINSNTDYSTLTFYFDNDFFNLDGHYVSHDDILNVCLHVNEKEFEISSNQELYLRDKLKEYVKENTTQLESIRETQNFISNNFHSHY